MRTHFVSTVFGLSSLAIVSIGTSACSSSNEALEAVARANDPAYASKATESVGGATDRSDPNAKLLYFDEAQTVTLSMQRPTVRFAFRAHGDSRTRVVVVGDETRIALELYAKRESGRIWETIAETSGQDFAELSDAPGEVRAYQIQVTGTPGRSLTVRLACDAESRDQCAPFRQPNDVCGSRMRIESECAEGLFCDLVRNSCGEADQGGRCQHPPSSCQEMWKPVCGCDGRTYGNDCLAARERKSVRYEGECRPEDRPDM